MNSFGQASLIFLQWGTVPDLETPSDSLSAKSLVNLTIAADDALAGCYSLPAQGQPGSDLKQLSVHLDDGITAMRFSRERRARDDQLHLHPMLVKNVAGTAVHRPILGFGVSANM